MREKCQENREDLLGSGESVKEIGGGPAVTWGKCQWNRGRTLWEVGKVSRK